MSVANVVWEEADLVIRGQPVGCQSVMAFHVAWHLARMGHEIIPAHGLTWDELAEQLATRFPPHLWHPCHWPMEDLTDAPY